jgi:hypothetical protein
MKKLLFTFLLAVSSAVAADIRVETTFDFVTWHTIRQDRIPDGFARLNIVGNELLVEHSADKVSWITDIRIPIARSVNPHEFFRLTVL